MIIYLTGKAGVGKYTIAKELSKHGFIVCDNQLINNPIFELLGYDGYKKIPEYAWESIEQIRNAVMEFLSNHKTNNYVLTNVLYEGEIDRKIYAKVKDMAEKRGSIFVPVRLNISQEEHMKRITQNERLERFKTIDLENVYDEKPLLKIEHPNFLEIDVSNLKPENVVERILRHLNKINTK